MPMKRKAMEKTTQPFVSVLTPVYNMGDYLGDCIESVLNQTYGNFEYIIVNNRSTDQTLDVAMKYAAQDSRIRVVTNERFVPVIENHNIAFGLMSPSAKYCKLVCADDFIFPECISRMVELAEANPSVGIVGCYQLSGDHILWQGFEYPRSVFSGRELGRRMFLANDPALGFGTPSSTMYRADLVREISEFFPNPSPHADTSACFATLRKSDFGFIHQVLSYERTHSQTQSSASKALDRYSSAYLNDLIVYGPHYLQQDELNRCIAKSLKAYRRSLGVSYVVGSQGKEYWQYHEGRLRELAFPLTRVQLLRAVAVAALREMANPAQAIAKLRRRLVPGTTKIVSSVPPVTNAT
jgi:glycosyltransferase involved in cell wall biosynthesis